MDRAYIRFTVLSQCSKQIYRVVDHFKHDAVMILPRTLLRALNKAKR